MIHIVAIWKIKPEFADQWPALSADFTKATQAEPGNRWFEWSRSLDNENTYVLIEAFDDDAAQAHVDSDHFRKATAELPQYLAETPKIINTTVEQDGWSELGEMAVG